MNKKKKKITEIKKTTELVYAVGRSYTYPALFWEFEGGPHRNQQTMYTTGIKLVNCKKKKNNKITGKVTCRLHLPLPPWPLSWRACISSSSYSSLPSFPSRGPFQSGHFLVGRYCLTVLLGKYKPSFPPDMLWINIPPILGNRPGCRDKQWYLAASPTLIRESLSFYA